MTTSQAAARPGLRHWIDRNILDLGRQVRPAEVAGEDAAAAHAAARNIDRQQRADEAMTTASVILDDLPVTAADLAFLRVANRAWPVSLVAALQLGNEAEFLNVEELSKTNALLAQLGQVQVDQLVQDDYARQVAIEQAKAFYGAEGFTGGRVAAHTMNLPW